MSGNELRLKPHVISGFLIAVSIAVGLTAGENWLARAIAGALLLVGGVTALVSAILSRKFCFIGRKLVDKSLRLRLAVEIFGRLVFLVLVVFVAPILFYMCLDFYELIRRGHPLRTEAIVTYVPSGAIWNWAWKDLGLETQNGNTSRYNLFFHPEYPSQGQQYEVAILPRSKCVLSLKTLPQSEATRTRSARLPFGTATRSLITKPK
jgi:hypothetical protein